jgi:hypothetical protein
VVVPILTSAVLWVLWQLPKLLVTQLAALTTPLFVSAPKWHNSKLLHKWLLLKCLKLLPNSNWLRPKL